jgi:uncharacterized membrane protein YedE/YeeE
VTARYRQAALGLVCGLMFAAGLVLSGMTDPSRVLAFLDFAGDWDPRLALVMLGAIGVHFSWLRLAPRVQGPTAQALSLAPHARVTPALVVGSAIFGVGWGLSGYCPGPAVVSLGLRAREGSLFFLAMLGGMALHRVYLLWQTRRSEEHEASAAVSSR